MENNRSPKQELEHILSSTEITHIDQIQFFPTNGEMFSSKNENVMKLAVYISKSLGKKTFTAGELKKAFAFVITNLDSHLPREEYTSIVGTIQSFIHSGGRIEILEKSAKGETMSYIDPESRETKPETKNPNSSVIGSWDEIKTFSQSQIPNPPPAPAPILTIPAGKEKIMTWKNVLMGFFILSPISGIISGLIVTPLRVIFSLIGYYNNSSLIFGIASLIITPIIWVLLSERILKLSRKGSMILFVIISLIGIGIFAAVCGGIILIFFR